MSTVKQLRRDLNELENHLRRLEQEYSFINYYTRMFRDERPSQLLPRADGLIAIEGLKEEIDIIRKEIERINTNNAKKRLSLAKSGLIDSLDGYTIEKIFKKENSMKGRKKKTKKKKKKKTKKKK